MKTELIVALDTEDINFVKNIVVELSDIVYAFKIGPQLFLSHGVSALNVVNEFEGRIFLDLKFFDIPSIVRKSVGIISKFNIRMFTLHILGGEKMLREVVDYITSQNSNILPFGVTILTSMNQNELMKIGINQSIKSQVLKLAYLAKKVGLKGLICSPQDIELIRSKFGTTFKLGTPGVRLENDMEDDQIRTATPEEAAKKGADYIIIGRPILNSKNPRKLAEKVSDALIEGGEYLSYE